MTLPRGRIVKGPAREKARAIAAPPSSDATGRLRKSVLLEAQEKARAELEAAAERARAIVAEAEQQARSLRARAEQDGRDAGTAEVAAAWVKLRTDESARAEKDLDRTIDLARAMAERLLGEALELDSTKVLSIAKQVLASAQHARRVVWKAHPEDAAVLTRHFASLGLEGAAIEIHADATRTRGSLLVDTDLGILDANVTIQLDRLARSLRDSLGS